MKKFILPLFVFASTFTPVNTESFNDIINSKPDTLNCMASRRCRDGIKTIDDISDISNSYPDSNFDIIADEFNTMLATLKRIGIKVFLGDEKYFPITYRGVYSTKRNTFYLNKGYMYDPKSLIRTMRHEGWHVAQDCKADINNMRLELLVSEYLVPEYYRNLAKEIYHDEPDQIPFESEAYFAAYSKDLTQLALDVCARRLR
tara:strand:- start:166 stop:771 length:606 start_codon:yes stop_codon:yes gene_type:complete